MALENTGDHSLIPDGHPKPQATSRSCSRSKLGWEVSRRPVRRLGSALSSSTTRPTATPKTTTTSAATTRTSTAGCRFAARSSPAARIIPASARRGGEQRIVDDQVSALSKPIGGSGSGRRGSATTRRRCSWAIRACSARWVTTATGSASGGRCSAPTTTRTRPPPDGERLVRGGRLGTGLLPEQPAGPERSRRHDGRRRGAHVGRELRLLRHRGQRCPAAPSWGSYFFAWRARRRHPVGAARRPVARRPAVARNADGRLEVFLRETTRTSTTCGRPRRTMVGRRPGRRWAASGTTTRSSRGTPTAA